MIDWSLERTTKNYCGYCISSPPGNTCNGTCFEVGYYQWKQNRADHIKAQLKAIPKRIKMLQNTLQKFEDEEDKYSDLGIFESS